jgi:thiol-disulfide isomerase/thioredoxin
MEGSVLRTGGDYRYLQGYAHADSAKLSGFNGGTAYLVNFEKVDTNNIKGNITYLSGSQESFTAYRNPNATLDNAKAISSVKQIGAGFPFQAQNLDGELVNQNNSLFAGKTLLIQISGSWCPNCMDETRYFTELHNKYQPKGLEIVSVYFEYSDDFAKSVAAIRRTQKNLNVPYTMLLGGKVSAENVQKVFTNLQNFYAYPTSVLVNKDGQVVHIYTGFSGPGTGKYFQTYKEEFENSLIEIL